MASQERLLEDSELLVVEDEGAGHAQQQRDVVALTPRAKKLLLGFAGLAVVAVVLGVVLGGNAAAGRTHNSPAASSSKSFNERPEFAAHRVLGQLERPLVTVGADGMKTASMMFHHEANGRHTHLEYEVTHRDHVHSPDEDANITSIKCEADSLTITTNSTVHSARDYRKGHILTLRGEWGCGAHIRELTGDPTIRAGTTIVVHTKNITLASVFKSARIRYSSNEPAEKRVKFRPADATAAARPPRHRRGLFDFLHKAWDDIEDAGKAIYDLGKLAVTGGLEVDSNPLSSEWQVGPEDCLLGEVDGASSQCTAKFDVTTNLDVDITDYDLKNFKITVGGDASMTSEGSFTVSEPYTYSKQKMVLNDRVWSGVIPVGEVPIPISIVVLLFLGFDFTIDASVTLSGSVGASGTATYGYQYYPGIAESDKWIHEHSFQPVQTNLEIKAQLTATVAFNIQPVILLEAAFVGGPTAQVSVTPTFKVQGTAVADDSNGDVSTCTSASADFDVDLGLGLGADIDIEIGGDTIFQKKVSIFEEPIADIPVGTLQFGDANC